MPNAQNKETKNMETDLQNGREKWTSWRRIKYCKELKRLYIYNPINIYIYILSISTLKSEELTKKNKVPDKKAGRKSGVKLGKFREPCCQ